MTVVPAERWLPFFSHFTDAQILNPDYALSSSGTNGKWCKLCDAHVPGDPEAHMEAHTVNLAAYRASQRAEALRRARETREKTL